jgi:hypothetical protein
MLCRGSICRRLSRQPATFVALLSSDRTCQSVSEGDIVPVYSGISSNLEARMPRVRD